MSPVARVRRLPRLGLMLFVTVASAAPALAQSAPSAGTMPPVAVKRPKIDTLHGERRVDEYFWLREKTNPEVKEYLEAENAYAEQYLAPTKPLQERLYQEMLGRIKQTDLSVPYPMGGWLYYTRTEEGKQYPIFARKRGSLEAAEEVLLDLNTMAEGQTFMALGDFEVSDDGNYLAYSTDSTGFREYTLHVKDLRTGQVLPDRAEKVSSVAWAADNETLFYVTDDAAKRPYRLHRHALGATSSDLLYEEKDESLRVFTYRTRSRAYVIAAVASLTTSEARILPADQPAGEWMLISPRKQDREYYVDHHGDSLYIRVNDTGRNFRVVAAPVSAPVEANWRELIPHRDDVMIEELDFFADHYVVYEREAGLPQLRITDFRSGGTHRVAFPEPAYQASPSTNREWNTTAFRYAYQSLVTPSSVYEYDMDARRQTLLKQTEVLGGYEADRYASERIYATARDGTRIPISLVYRKDVPRDGRAPMLLGGYGSYGYPFPVSFSSTRLSLLDRGVVLAYAHIRGGGEMGKAWHDDGRMDKKMNTFTDFIAAAEHLIAERYAAKDRLVIEGGSAGGLLMGAVTNLRPDLFHAVVSHVPFVDVINTMSDPTLPLTVGEFEEWGNPADSGQYVYIRQYSPYENLESGAYPAMLVKTSFNDSQVMYWEPAKYVARLRSLKTDDRPLLLVTNMGAGHGGASGRYDRLREIALDYAFMLQQMGVPTEITP